MNDIHLEEQFDHCTSRAGDNYNLNNGGIMYALLAISYAIIIAGKAIATAILRSNR